MGKLVKGNPAPEFALVDQNGKSLYGNEYMGIIRSVFQIDEEGHIVGAWYKIVPEGMVS